MAGTEQNELDLYENNKDEREYDKDRKKVGQHSTDLNGVENKDEV